MKLKKRGLALQNCKFEEANQIEIEINEMLKE